MSLLLISLISLHQPQTAEALPLTTATELLNDHVQSNQTIDHWIHEPEVRGTWGILSSCLFTLTLCVYTAIHLNVPRSEESFGARVLRKSKWVLVAIFAPEVVLYSAYVQWNAARVLVKDLNAIAKRAGHVRGGGKSKENISEPMEVQKVPTVVYPALINKSEAVMDTAATIRHVLCVLRGHGRHHD
jgi:hypothetical protein